MSSKTTLFIAGLTILTVALVVIAISPKKSTAPSSTTSPKRVVVSPTPIVEKHSVLSFAPNPLVLSATTATVSVSLDSSVGGSNRVTAVQLEMTYDPKAITVTSVTPATFFTNPFILMNKVDPAAGTISFALGAAPGSTGTSGIGNVATISFTSLMTQGQSTTITFLPRSLVTAEGQSQSVIKSTTNLQITQQ